MFFANYAKRLSTIRTGIFAENITPARQEGSRYG
jgi:hypothetical protein